jgi:hypothetical protein
MEILRVAPIIIGLLLGLRFLFYNEEEWNLDRLYRRIRWGRKWKSLLAGGAVLPVNPWFTRIAGFLLLGGVIYYALAAYEVEAQTWLLKLL